MSIREKYVRVVEDIAERDGVLPLEMKKSYKIPAGATRLECIEYTLGYVVGVAGDREHYRYKKYYRALNSALRMIASRTEYRVPQLHIDVGCGPGLFTWVVRDKFRCEQLDVDLYGYDHAKEMVKLATEIWTKLDESVGYACYYNALEMLSTVSASDNSCDHALVTFGHVLVQTHDKKYVIRKFGRIISRSFAVNCLVVAVDAQKKPDKFRKGCDSLKHELLDQNLKVDVIHYEKDESCYIANVTK